MEIPGLVWSTRHGCQFRGRCSTARRRRIQRSRERHKFALAFFGYRHVQILLGEMRIWGEVGLEMKQWTSNVKRFLQFPGHVTCFTAQFERRLVLTIFVEIESRGDGSQHATPQPPQHTSQHVDSTFWVERMVFYGLPRQYIIAVRVTAALLDDDPRIIHASIHRHLFGLQV